MWPLCRVVGDPVLISYNPVKFRSQMPCGRENIIFFICHVTLCDHVIEEMCDFMVNGSSSQATIPLSLRAAGLLKVI